MDEPGEATAAIVNPQWLLLNRYGSWRSDASIAGDVRTVTDSCTSTGWPFRVSFGLAPPPSISCLNHTWLGIEPPGGDRNDPARVVAAHGDCVLFELKTPQTHPGLNLDYFLYESGTNAARPPSISMLPVCYIPVQYERHRSGDTRRREGRNRMLQEEDTVVLRRGDGGGDILVAQLEVFRRDDELEAYSGKVPTKRINAELCVIGGGRGGWELMEAVPITFHGELASGGDGAELMPQWETDAAIPVGDRFLCFVDYLRGMLLCDTTGIDSHRPLTLWYVPLPVVVPNHICKSERPGTRRTRNLSAAAGTCAVWFVSINTRCCCGGSGWTSCARGRFAFTVTMWSLNLMTVDDEEPSLATWVKDGVLDCEEVWELAAYKGIPQVYLEYPIVSSDNPDVVCFTVCEGSSRDKKIWMVEANLRSKELLSVIPCTTNPWRTEYRVAAELRCNLLLLLVL